MARASVSKVQGRRPSSGDVTIALLRAVNLGGATQIDHGTVCRILDEAGWGPSRSVLNSGNFLLHAHGHAPDQLESGIAELLARTYHRPATVFVREADEWSALLARNPFPEEARNDPAHVIVGFLKSNARPGPCRELEARTTTGERLRPAGRHLFVHYPNGIGRSWLTLPRIESAIGSECTARNWNTVNRLERLVNPAA